MTPSNELPSMEGVQENIANIMGHVKATSDDNRRNVEKIQQTLDEQQRFMEGQLDEFMGSYRSCQVEKEQLMEEIKSLKESKEHTEAALANLREHSTTKQHADRREIEILQAYIKRQHNEMETAKQEHERAMRGERDLHSLAMERTRREHVQGMDAARVESDQRLSNLREEHTKLVDKSQEERTQAINQVRLEHDQAMSEAYREHVQAMDTAQFESDRRLRQSREEHAQAMDITRAEHAQALSKAQEEHFQALSNTQGEHTEAMSKAQEEHAQAMAKTRAEHAQTLENAETRSTTKSKIIASNLSVLHRSDADAEERVNELCQLFEGMQSTGTQQLSPDLFPDNRRFDSTNTVMEERLTLVAGDSGALFLFDKHSGIYMFRAEDLDYVSVATYKLMLVFRGDLCLPERLRSITLWDGVAETWDFVMDWRVEYLGGVVSKYEK